MKRLAFMACVAAGGVSLNAGTVVHYTFDSGNVGDVLADASTIVNVANPGVHDATVYGLNTTTLLPSSSLMKKHRSRLTVCDRSCHVFCHR